MKKWIIALAITFTPVNSDAQPLHNPIPKEFHGVFATKISECKFPYEDRVISISSNGVHYYEGDDYLIMGIEFGGSSTKSGKLVPLFNGRFTGRNETKLLGEMNVRMEMETPNLLIRYALNDDGVPDPHPSDIWVRCPSTTE
ncbi:hypothetical protein [Novosphingobium percolationis]|uniref:hypothetical protein n=1 Tax=Novosphingobium percolationis TaxID=2871811 RepID=UPI001CD1FEA1|nr:hypothetical protein [Novosphingobium percolationis]